MRREFVEVLRPAEDGEGRGGGSQIVPGVYAGVANYILERFVRCYLT